MVFNPQSMLDLHLSVFYLNGAVLDKVSKQIYMGIIVTDDQKDNCNIQRQVKYVCSHGNVIIKRFNFYSDDANVKLFTSYCNRFYCAQLWSKSKHESMRKLASAYHRI